MAMNTVTNETIFQLTMALIDEVEEDGTVSRTTTLDYRGKAPYMLTLINEDLIQSGIIPLKERTVLTAADMEADSILPYETAVNVAPYGLGNYLLIDENQTLASALGREYESRKANIRLKAHSIEDRYNLLGGLRSW